MKNIITKPGGGIAAIFSGCGESAENPSYNMNVETTSETPDTPSRLASRQAERETSGTGHFNGPIVRRLNASRQSRQLKTAEKSKTRRSKPDLKGLLEVQEVYGISFKLVEKSAEGGMTLFGIEVKDPVGLAMKVPRSYGYSRYFWSTNRDYTQSCMLRWLKSGQSELKSRLFHIRVPRFDTVDELRMKVAIREYGND